LIQGFNDYNEWIQQRSNLIHQFQSIRHSYEKQCEDIVNYVDMIDDLRTVVYKNIRELGGTPSTTMATSDYLQAPPLSTVRSHPYQMAEDDSCHSAPAMSAGEEDEEMDGHPSNNKNLMKKIRGTTRKTIQQAEEGFIKLDNVIRQLRTSIHKK
jgi:hypothetical protein